MDKRTLKRFDELCKKFDEYYLKNFGYKGPLPNINVPADFSALLNEDKHQDVNIGQPALGYLKSLVTPYPSEVDMDILKKKTLTSWTYYDDFFDMVEKKNYRLFIAETDFSQKSINEILQLMQKGKGLSNQSLYEVFMKLLLDVLSKTVKDLGITKNEFDLRNKEQQKKIADSIADRFGGVTVLIDNRSCAILMNKEEYKNESILNHEFMHVVQCVCRTGNISDEKFVPFELNDLFNKFSMRGFDEGIKLLSVIGKFADKHDDFRTQYNIDPRELKPLLYVNLFTALQKCYHDKNILGGTASSWEDFVDIMFDELEDAIRTENFGKSRLIRAMDLLNRTGDSNVGWFNALITMYSVSTHCGDFADTFLSQLKEDLKNKKKP